MELARRYAFSFFFQLMVPFDAVTFKGPRIAHIATDASEICQGATPVLDNICESILRGRDIVLPRELALHGRSTM